MFPKKVFVHPAEVAPLLSQLQPVDVRYALGKPEYGRELFKRSRLPTAVFADADADLSGKRPGSAARHPLPEASRFIGWCQAKEITKPVLCYDDMGGALAAARLWWMLDQLSIEAYILDGGFQHWVASGLPLDESPPSSMAASFDISRTPDLSAWRGSNAFKSQVLLADIPIGALVIDGRTADRFSSTARPMGLDITPGHMPGAISHPFSSNLQPAPGSGFNVVKPKDVLAQQLRQTLGSRKVSDCVLMCASGVTACMNAAVLRHTHLDSEGAPRLYDGSWSEYGGGATGFDLQRRVLEQHGALVLPVKANPAGGVLSDSDMATVEGRTTPTPIAAMEPVILREAVLRYMKKGETMRVIFPSGESFVVTTAP